MNLPYYGVLDTNRQRISEVNTESRLFSDVFEKDNSGKVHLPDNADLPVVMKYYHIIRFTRSGQEDPPDHAERATVPFREQGG